MGIQTIEFCSLRYLNLWVGNDESCVLELSKGDKNKKLSALRKAGQFYSVARNLPLKFDVNKGLKRYEPVLNILDKVHPEMFLTDTVENIYKISNEISEQYSGRGVLSLTTKFL